MSGFYFYRLNFTCLTVIIAYGALKLLRLSDSIHVFATFDYLRELATNVGN